jgi:hypothetical protein
LQGRSLRLAAPLLLLLLWASSGPDANTGATPVGDDVVVVLRTPASKAERDRMRAKLATATKSLPTPTSAFRLADEGEERGVGSDAGKLDEPDSWNPIQAWVSRLYETRTGAEDDERSVEVNLALNGERGLSKGLASVGGEAQVVPLKGALAVRQSILGADDSRVALPLSQEDAARALTLLRIHVVSPDLEVRLRRHVEGTGQLPRIEESHLTTKRPDAIAALVVEIRGERRDVDAFAAGVGVAALRKLLGP